VLWRNKWKPWLEMFCMEFRALTVLNMNISVFWYIMSYSPLKVSLSFGGTYRLHLHGRRTRVRNNDEAGSKPIRPWLLRFFLKHVQFQWTTGHCISEELNLHICRIAPDVTVDRKRGTRPVRLNKIC
jgi:hypothetical protein